MRRAPIAVWLGLGALQAQIRVDVNLVTVATGVTDRSGAPVKNLRAEDFELRDNGRQQKIEYLWQEQDLPLTVGLLVDVSGSQSAFIEQHRAAVAQFLAQVIGLKDRAFIVTVGTEARLVTDLTGSVGELRDGAQRIDAAQTAGSVLGESCLQTIPVRGCGGTALWNGVYAATRQKMQWVQGRKALVIVSDGFDTGSPHTLADAIQAVQESGTVVYAIKYVDPEVTPAMAGISRREAAAHGMERLTEETGGYTFPDPGDRLSDVFDSIERELRNQYVLGFTPPPKSRDGRYHRLEVKVRRRDLVVRARAGYYASAR
ncbi:MAG TPA: VWA domain-containing protein [Bryobacteraceae bacterium]|nr:VWA domain-containing protein [Bryobacteraceae bacterium]